MEKKKKGLMYDKCLSFSIRIVRLKEYLSSKNNQIIEKQILRSGTSIGANYSEALAAESNNDFVHKMKISFKEILEKERCEAASKSKHGKRDFSNTEN